MFAWGLNAFADNTKIVNQPQFPDYAGRFTCQIVEF
jgi:hypothetical protein